MKREIPIPQLNEAARALATAEHGGKGAVLESYAARLGYSVRQLRRALKTAGLYGGERKSRADSGEFSPELAAQVEKVFLVKNRLDAKERNVGAEVAIETAEESGLIAPGAVKPHHVHLYGRKTGLNRRTVNHHRYETERPNELHIADWSGSEYLFPIEYDEERKDWLLGVAGRSRESAKNRPHRVSRPGSVWIAGLVDHSSRYLYASLMVQPGEDIPGWTDFLLDAWGRKADTRFPFRGLPTRLMTDQKLLKSPTGQEFLATLGVEAEPHMPYNPNAQGAIERAWRTVFEQHEIRFLLSGRETIWLSEAQSRLRDWLVQYNSRVSPSLLNEVMLTRVESWMRVLETGIRDLPEGLMSGRIAVKRYARKVQPLGGGCVQVDNVLWEIEHGPAEMDDKDVIVIVGFGGEVAVQWRGMVFDCHKYRPQIMGQPRALEQSPAQRSHAAGVELGELKTFGATAETNVRALPVRGEEVEVISPLAATGYRYRDVDEVMVDFGRALERKGADWQSVGEEVYGRIRAFVEANFGDQALINEKLREFERAG